MVRAELKVLEGGLEENRRARGRTSLGLFAAIAGAALAATLLGADRGRAPFDAVALGARGEREAALSGGESPEVRAVLRELRGRLGERPLDAAARLAYAGVLREAATSPAGIEAAIFHAELGAKAAPVTAGFVGTAARILARSGRTAQAEEMARGMFAWNPPAAAALLRDVEPFLAEGAAGRVVPPEARGRKAWIAELRRAGRTEEARAALVEALALAPEDPGLVELAAREALAAGDLARLAELIPDGAPLPRGGGGATALALRALGKARRGDRLGAAADARSAIDASSGATGVLVTAGDALDAAGDLDGARDAWQRARFALPRSKGASPVRVALSVRLARVEEKAGRPGEALRAWGEVLEQDPSHAEALSRRDALRGVR